MKLLPAITAQGAKGITGEAFGVEAHGDVIGVGDITLYQGCMFLAITVVVEGYNLEIAKAGGEFGNGCDLDTGTILTQTFTLMCAVFFE